MSEERTIIANGYFNDVKLNKQQFMTRWIDQVLELNRLDHTTEWQDEVQKMVETVREKCYSEFDRIYEIQQRNS